MSLKKFIFFLVEIDGRCRQIVNGIVVSLSQPKQLSQAPDGNQEIAIGWERSQVYHGNVRMFALPFGYIMEAATMLRNDFYKFNLDRVLFLSAKKLTYEYTPTTFKEYYKQIYKGQLDWASAEDDQGNFRFNIGLLEAGIQKLIKANEGTEYEILFDMDAKNISMDGMYIQGGAKILVVEQNILTSAEKTIILYLISTEQSPGIIFFSVSTHESITDFVESINYFMQATLDVLDISFKWLITFTAPETDFEIQIKTNTGRIIPVASNAGPVVSSIVADITFDAFVNEKFFLTITGNIFNTINFGESRIEINLKSKPATSVIKGFTLYDLGIKLIEKITGASGNFESTFLATKNIILTSGDGVRGIPNASIKTNLHDYWKAVDVYTKAQLTITDKVRINSRLTAFDPDKIPIPLGIVKAFKVTPATDYIWTSVKVGHREPQTDDTNGKFDFNSFMIFETGIAAVPDRQLDLQSPYKASPWEIEQTRANYDGKTTTDKTSDNDIYAIAVLPDPASDSFGTTGSFSADGTPLTPGLPLLSITHVSPVIRPGMKLRFTGSVLNTADYTVLASTVWIFGQLINTNEPLIDEPGVVLTIEILEGQYYILDRTPVISQLTIPDITQEIKDTVYNVPLSPKRIFNLHKGWIAGSCYGYAPGSIIFTSNNRNKELIADGIIEKADIPITDLGDPDYMPKLFEFDTLAPIDMTETLEADPNPNMQLEWNGNIYTGFFLRGGIALNDLEEQTFKLLACKENNVLNLI